jgi:hypothetical protein
LRNAGENGKLLMICEIQAPKISSSALHVMKPSRLLPIALACCIVSMFAGCDRIKHKRAVLAGVKRVPIPERDSGYHYLDSHVVGSDRGFDALLRLVESQEHWGRKAEFLNALRREKPDFRKAVLVLITDTLGSGSIKVALDGPYADGQDVVYRINYDVPRLLTADMAYRCFAVIVPKGVGDRVLVTRHGRRGKKPQSLALELNE